MERIRKREESGGWVDASGYQAQGVACDIRGRKDGRLDLALLVSSQPAALAGVFTRNRLAAAPVRLCRKVLSSRIPVKGVVVNSGNANACTGARGVRDAEQMQALAAEVAGCQAGEMLVCSTGRIGQPLPMDRLAIGLESLRGSLAATRDAGWQAADAILTSDSRRKVCSVEVETSQGICRVAGMAKGAGMIQPDMATMLAFLCTDARIKPEPLQASLASSVQSTFNAITVDGDCSTNDTVLLLANGASGVSLDPGGPAWADFEHALFQVCADLADKIVGDGEKITKVVEIRIEGAASGEEAHQAARAVGNSLLVKTSWFGNDPNWGRLLDAVGYSGARLSEDSLQLWYESVESEHSVPVFAKGRVFAEWKSSWIALVSLPRFRIRMDLGQGGSEARIWATDLTEGYVHFNKSE